MEIKRNNRINKVKTMKDYFYTLVLAIDNIPKRNNLMYKLASVEKVIDKIITDKNISINQFLKNDPLQIFCKEGYTFFEKNCIIVVWYTTFLMQLSNRLRLTDNILYEYDKIKDMISNDPGKLFEYIVENGFNTINLYSCECYVIAHELWIDYCKECNARTDKDDDLRTSDAFPVSTFFMWNIINLLDKKNDKDLFDHPVVSLREYCILKTQQDSIK